MLVLLLAALASPVVAPTPTEAAAPPVSERDGLILHEWGTFTAVADAEGRAVPWHPLAAPSDLPSFVHTLGEGDCFGYRDCRGKGMRAEIRMETPVIYFYADQEMDVSLSVDFPGGRITEWYPRVDQTESGVNWGTFRVIPGGEAVLPTESAPSHYYPARNVDSDLVRVCSTAGNEAERFLFYRGVGDTGLDLRARLDTDGLHLSGHNGTMVVFERQGSEAGLSVTDGTSTVSRPQLAATDNEAVLSELRSLLLAEGLYADEVEAMLDTWDDHWFEDGLRVFYVVPQRRTDEILPLQVSPTPSETVRVIVGRVEVPTPEQISEVRQDLHGHFGNLPDDTLVQLRERHGRFVEPILRRLVGQDRLAGNLLHRLDRTESLALE